MDIEGQRVSLTLYRESGRGRFFLPFRDATSGDETYSGGRYLDPQETPDGLVTVDFNYAYNPYCAYNDEWTCPIPPPENVLSVAVAPGKKHSRSTSRHNRRIMAKPNQIGTMRGEAMKIQIQAGNLVEQAVDAIVLGVAPGRALRATRPPSTLGLRGHLKAALDDSAFKGKVGTTQVIPTLGRLPARRIIVTGVGESDHATGVRRHPRLGRSGPSGTLGRRSNYRQRRAARRR